ncbi:unnamed protein product [Amoebophrya sp. A120]|nr:unnamed protein product [Amoebophrya sp. A120]|eukprot:GSA120T00004188001.1
MNVLNLLKSRQPEFSAPSWDKDSWSARFCGTEDSVQLLPEQENLFEPKTFADYFKWQSVVDACIARPGKEDKCFFHAEGDAKTVESSSIYFQNKTQRKYVSTTETPSPASTSAPSSDCEDEIVSNVGIFRSSPHQVVSEVDSQADAAAAIFPDSTTYGNDEKDVAFEYEHDSIADEIEYDDSVTVIATRGPDEDFGIYNAWGSEQIGAEQPDCTSYSHQQTDSHLHQNALVSSAVTTEFEDDIAIGDVAGPASTTKDEAVVEEAPKRVLAEKGQLLIASAAESAPKRDKFNLINLSLGQFVQAVRVGKNVATGKDPYMLGNTLIKRSKRGHDLPQVLNLDRCDALQKNIAVTFQECAAPAPMVFSKLQLVALAHYFNYRKNHVGEFPATARMMHAENHSTGVETRTLSLLQVASNRISDEHCWMPLLLLVPTTLTSTTALALIFRAPGTTHKYFPTRLPLPDAFSVLISSPTFRVHTRQEGSATPFFAQDFIKTAVAGLNLLLRFLLISFCKIFLTTYLLFSSNTFNL